MQNGYVACTAQTPAHRNSTCEVEVRVGIIKKYLSGIQLDVTGVSGEAALLYFHHDRNTKNTDIS